MKIKVILYCIFLVSLSSCTFIIKKWAGIKNPKLESIHSINHYANKKGIDTSMFIFSKDSASLFKLNNMFSSFPEILVFDKQKKFIPYKNDSSTCNGPVDNTLKGICNISSNNFLSTKKILYDSLLNCIIDPNKCLKSFDIKDVDYVVFVNFQKNFPRLIRTHIVPWNAVIKANNANCNELYNSAVGFIKNTSKNV